MIGEFVRDVLRMWGRVDQKDPWRGCEGTHAAVFKDQFMQLAAACSWRMEGARARFNREEYLVEIVTSDDLVLASICVAGGLDQPTLVHVLAHSLTEREIRVLKRLINVPVTFGDSTS
jgi:hypothetical protein